jgi:hypothetical protein
MPESNSMEGKAEGAPYAGGDLRITVRGLWIPASMPV